MTNNKMPVVGERYRKIPSYTNQPECIYKIVREGKGTFGNRYVFVEEEGSLENGFAVSEFDFFDLFEPIPQDPISQPSIPVKEGGQKIKCLCKFTKQIGSGSCIACTEYNKWVQDSCVTTVSSNLSAKEERLPEVGEVYRYELEPNINQIVSRVVHNDSSGFGYTVFFESGEFALSHIFRDRYRKIPSDSQKPLEAKEERKTQQFVLSDEVREAMKKLEKESDIVSSKIPNGFRKEWNDGCAWWSLYLAVRMAAHDLLNALESMDKPEKGDCGIVEDPIKLLPNIICGECGKPHKIKSYNIASDKGYTIGDSIITERDCECGNDQVEEDCEFEQAADEWNTQSIKEEKKSEEEKVIVSCDVAKGADKTVYSLREGSKIIYYGEKIPDWAKKEESKSIWKDVSELPIRGEFVVKDSKGEITIIRGVFNCLSGTDWYLLNGCDTDPINCFKEFTTLGEFFKQVDSLEQRIRKLEGK